jgi:hypothetical protein
MGFADSKSETSVDADDLKSRAHVLKRSREALERYNGSNYDRYMRRSPVYRPSDPGPAYGFNCSLMFYHMCKERTLLALCFDEPIRVFGVSDKAQTNQALAFLAMPERSIARCPLLRRG